jgi:hypothetical protein
MRAAIRDLSLWALRIGTVNHGSGDEQEGDPDASNDEPESMMEISFGTADDLQINMAEIHDSVARQRQREAAKSELKSCAYRASVRLHSCHSAIWPKKRRNKSHIL